MYLPIHAWLFWMLQACIHAWLFCMLHGMYLPIHAWLFWMLQPRTCRSTHGYVILDAAAILFELRFQEPTWITCPVSVPGHALRLQLFMRCASAQPSAAGALEGWSGGGAGVSRRLALWSNLTAVPCVKCLLDTDASMFVSGYGGGNGSKFQCLMSEQLPRANCRAQLYRNSAANPSQMYESVRITANLQSKRHAKKKGGALRLDNAMPMCIFVLSSHARTYKRIMHVRAHVHVYPCMHGQASMLMPKLMCVHTWSNKHARNASCPCSCNKNTHAPREKTHKQVWTCHAQACMQADAYKNPFAILFLAHPPKRNSTKLWTALLLICIKNLYTANGKPGFTQTSF